MSTKHLNKMIIVFFLTVLQPFADVFPQRLAASAAYEPDNPTPLTQPDMDRWRYIDSGLHASFGSIDMRYDRDRIPLFVAETSWSGSAWRGEKLNLQLVLWSSTGVGQVRVQPSALINEKNQRIEAENFQIHFIRYVLSDESFYGCSENTQLRPPVLVADILDNISSFDLAAKSTRPVWISLQVPPQTNPGVYQGRLSVWSQGGTPIDLSLELEVMNLTVAPPSDWEFQLDLWQNPWSVARYHDVKPWSEEHILLLKPLLKMLADAGQKYITTTIIDHPWNAQTFDPYETMIQWTKQKHGRWRFDYSIFDRYVELCMECGIKRYLSCYSMICFRNNYFRYFDEISGDFKFLYAEPGTREYTEHWRPFLLDFSEHLAAKGWLDRTCIAMDERPSELMKKVLALIHSSAPGLKVALASEDWQDELHRQIFSFSVSLGRYTRPEMVQERNRLGLVSTFYPCCVEPRPNNYPHSNPAESTWMGWLAAADEFSGILRWAYNSWVQDPLKDARYSQWNGGECFLVYPGPRSSIRFERLREGAQDYEKIRLVKNKLAGLKDQRSLQLAQELKRNLNGYSYSAAQKQSPTQMVQESKEVLYRVTKHIVESSMMEQKLND